MGLERLELRVRKLKNHRAKTENETEPGSM